MSNRPLSQPHPQSHSKDDTALNILLAGLVGLAYWAWSRPSKPAEYAVGDVMRVPYTYHGLEFIYEVRFDKNNLGLTLRQLRDDIREHIARTMAKGVQFELRCVQETPKWHSGVTVWHEPVRWFRGRHLKFHAAPVIDGEARWSLADQVAYAATVRDVTY